MKETNLFYEKFRWFFTSKGNLVIGGKSDSQNEVVLKEHLKPNYPVFHTASPGSPFIIIQKENPNKEEIYEAAIFCACFSKQWKLDFRKIDVDLFYGKQIYKILGMKTGTFGVRGKIEKLTVKPELVLIIQRGKIRAVPKGTSEEIICSISQGKLNKEQATLKILKIIKSKYHLPISKEEIMAAIPSDKLEIK